MSNLRSSRSIPGPATKSATLVVFGRPASHASMRAASTAALSIPLSMHQAPDRIRRALSAPVGRRWKLTESGPPAHAIPEPSAFGQAMRAEPSGGVEEIRLGAGELPPGAVLVGQTHRSGVVAGSRPAGLIRRQHRGSGHRHDGPQTGRTASLICVRCMSRRIFELKGPRRCMTQRLSQRTKSPTCHLWYQACVSSRTRFQI